MVIYEILSLGLSGASKTQIMYKANMSFHMAEYYISYLVGKEYLRVESPENHITTYELTTKGERFLHLLREVQTELADMFPSSRNSIAFPRTKESRTRIGLQGSEIVLEAIRSQRHGQDSVLRK